MEINKIYCESNLETMAKMPDNFIDLTITSPPYDNLRDYKGYSFPFENIAKELFRVTKDGGVIVWIVGDATLNGSETGTSFKQALFFKEIGFNIHDTMIYHKNFIQIGSSSPIRYHNNFEYMFIFTKGKIKTFNPIKDRKNINIGINKSSSIRQKNGYTKKTKDSFINDYGLRNNIWNYEVGYNKTTKDNNEHPAMFPEKLVSDHIHSWSNEGDLIYDPFMGSGTTAKMAHIYKRNWIGSEISEDYVNIANKRLKPYLDQQTLF
jgi:DNA modification methylase